MISMQEPKESVVFMPPIIGRKVYIVKSSSGWPETFDRKKLDAELVAFVETFSTVDELVSMFITAREIAESRKDKLIAWHTILGFLARTMGLSFEHVPHTVGIAFWAHVVIALQTVDAN